MALPVLFSFVRVGASTRAFPTPLTLREAAEHVDSWLNRSVVRVLTPGPDHAQRVFDLLEAAGSAGGNLVTDAQIAALAIAHRAVTCGVFNVADSERRNLLYGTLRPLD